MSKQAVIDALKKLGEWFAGVIRWLKPFLARSCTKQNWDKFLDGLTTAINTLFKYKWVPICVALTLATGYFLWNFIPANGERGVEKTGVIKMFIDDGLGTAWIEPREIPVEAGMTLVLEMGQGLIRQTTHIPFVRDDYLSPKEFFTFRLPKDDREMQIDPDYERATETIKCDGVARFSAEHFQLLKSHWSVERTSESDQNVMTIEINYQLVKAYDKVVRGWFPARERNSLGINKALQANHDFTSIEESRQVLGKHLEKIGIRPVLEKSKAKLSDAEGDAVNTARDKIQSGYDYLFNRPVEEISPKNADK